MTSPKPPPEARLIQRRREEPPRISMSEAARRAHMSDTRWRQLENGYRLMLGKPVRESAPAQTLAAMAQAVGVTPDELREAGRPDAAGELEALLAVPAPASSDDEFREQLDRIEALAREMRAQLDERRHHHGEDQRKEAGGA